MSSSVDMSSSSDPLPLDSPVAKPGQAAPPRKRRRRTAATGAAEDCFTCRKRQVKCDRRRPYCTQCLEIGKDCTGYKTTLTWGVGVASRGKLRGLSLPIANSSKKAPTSGDDGKDQATSAPKRDKSPPSHQEHLRKVQSGESFTTTFHNSSNVGASLYSPTSYNPTSPIPVPLSQAQNSWTSLGLNENFDGYNHNYVSKPLRMPIRPNPLRRIQTAPTLPYEETAYSTPSSAFSDSDYPSPRDFPATPEDFSIPEPYVGSYSDSYTCPPEQLHSSDIYGYGEPPRSYPVTSAFSMPSVSSATSPPGFNILPSNDSPATFADLLQCNNFTPTAETAHQFSVPQNVDQDYFSDGFSDFSVSHAPSSWPVHEPTEPSGLRSLPPRTRFFLESFDKAICPILVAVDDRRNPYRVHVMNSIITNMPLQYATAALVINQTRRRRSSDHVLPARSSSYVGPQASPEEVAYRSKATEAFNTALRHTQSVSTDSILIALLMLCLLNLSENGFGKFKVGIAGVKRLLASRGSETERQSDLAAWATQWFVWLDIIASVTTKSSVSESSPCLEALHISASLGSLEYVANCQGRLFKMVARLADWSPSSSRLTLSKDFYGLSLSGTSTSGPEPTSSFWVPLRQVHTRLNAFANHPSFHAREADSVIVGHLDEVFKLAAAIYAERQALIPLGSASMAIQRLVADSLCMIRALPANSSINELLLWPLMIIGSECVDGADRETVHRRVADCTSSLFIGSFNCADVLVKVWSLLDGGLFDGDFSDLERQYSGLNVLGARAAIWRQAISVLDGEASSFNEAQSHEILKKDFR